MLCRFVMTEENRSSVAENMDIKDLDLPDVKKQISPVSSEKTDVSAVSVKEEMHSDVSSEFNECSTDFVNDTLPQPNRQEGQECLSDSVTPFLFVGIKCEEPDDSESDTRSVNSETNYFTEENTSNCKEECDVQGLSHKSTVKLNRPSCVDIKMESEEVNDSAISGFQSNDDSVSTDTNNKQDSNSVVQRYNMGHSSDEFISGIDCDQFPVLCAEKEEIADQQFGENSNKTGCGACGTGKKHDRQENEIAIVCREDEESSNCTHCDNDTVSEIQCNVNITSHSPDNGSVSESKVTFEDQFEESKEALLNHKETFGKHVQVRTGGQSFSCAPFMASFNENFELLRHTLTHSELKPFKCVTCDASFTQKGSLVIHERTHSTEKPFKCVTCNASFAQKGNLMSHMRSHTGVKPFKCVTCDAAFTQKSNLMSHMRSHAGVKPFICVTCNASFTQKGNLMSHMQSHTGVKPFKCVTCNASFTRKSNLVSHARSHSGDKPFKCTTCNASFSAKNTLVNHFRTHTGEKPFKCVTCNATFSVKSSLVTHERTHTGVKPFNCVTCNASFSIMSSLVKHMRTHTGEKPFKCVSCNATFTVNSSLVSHMRTHTGVKPFKCVTCNASFSVKSSLVKHMRKLQCYTQIDTHENPLA